VKLLPAYKRLSGAATRLWGGEVTIAVKSKIAFAPDGGFVQASDVGAISPGDISGWATAVSGSNGKNGADTVKDHTITFTYANGTIERKFFAFTPKKTPPQPNPEIILIGDSVYTDD
jgi:hypothetical protein